MRRFSALILTLVLAAALACPAKAANSAEIIRAFVYDGTLYTYMRMEDMDQPVTKAEAKIGAQTFPASARLETVRQAGSPVTWLLMVDNSTSMPQFREQADAFARSLAQSAGENTRFVLATFGDAFQVAAEDMPAGELAERIGAIPFNERVTRLHTAIDQALTWFEDQPRQGNELRCLVILSDAVQYDPSGGVPYEELLERVNRSGVMLHNLGLGDDQTALDSLGRLAEASGGLHQVVGETSAEEAGTALSEFSDGFYVTGFGLSGCTAPAGETAVSVTLAAGSELVCRVETEVELPELAEVQVEAPAPDQEVPKDTLPSAGEPGGGASGGSPEASKGSPPVMLLVLGVLAVAALGIVLVLVLRRRKTTPSSPAAPEAPPVSQEAGVYMRLVVLEGELTAGPEELDLREPLFIGTGTDCVIRLRDGEEHRARLFLEDGAVCLEDLCTQGGTLVNGAKPERVRVLRSGDSVTIEDVTFQLRF